MPSTNKKLTETAIATFMGWDKTDVVELSEKGWDPDSIKRGIQHGLTTPSDFSELSLWSKTYLLRGHLWGDEPSETVKLAAERIPDDGKAADVGFGYGRDLLWLARRRGRVIGIEKSRVGLSIAMNALRELENNANNGNAARLGEVELIYGSMKSHRFAKGSLSGIFSHRMAHLPHPTDALPDIAQNMADAVKVGGVLVVSARSIHDFYQDQDKMTKVIVSPKGFPISAERIDRPEHKINYFSEERFREVFGPYCNIKELYLGKEPESLDNTKDGEQVYSYYMTAVMEVKPDSERTLSFGRDSSNGAPLPALRKFPSIPDDEDITYKPLETSEKATKAVVDEPANTM